jgi:hypothetical protein
VWVPLQVLHVTRQVGEQHLHLPAPLSLQEEPLVVAAGWKRKVTVQAGGNSSLQSPVLPCAR